ncbi:ATP-dependent RNA helicase [Streptomyces thermolilacinus]|uniref:ATP-dependent helicase n=1 Tax=Streptomyces thermolilacinus SPC6 TaxID=1306406 RepID=A0A1D3DWJ8_9ACTN|nr:ATP-dependent helicase C-terminal domain-containing protein [Streptomyces thermolilacinus]OEJ96698.1 ATP-dependent helicase [Streptomyces thermolilacinus SPC6]
MIREEERERLPVRHALPALERALDGHGAAVLCAPPGTGKTTLVPLALAERGARVVVAEPRRIAARGAARRMAWLLGQEVGGRVGFTVRGERVVSRETVVEVVTTGVLLQRLQRDQELPGVDVVMLDECHERHLDADTVAAFLLDVREALRPELRLLAASATTDAEGWARLLGGAPVVEAAGTAYPVEVVWAPPGKPVRPAHGMFVDPALLAHVAGVVRRALAERDGDVLCFLPGVGEIARVAGLLSDLRGVEVLQVHGRAPAPVQEAVLSPGRGRRVVLATAVAESSLTVPGVRVVVDSGLAREPRVDHARGLSALATVRASRASARQRAGRAGREAPGAVYRCWPEAEDGRLPAFPAPEIQVADLTGFALQVAAWGDPDASGLALLDAPPAGAMAAARSVLEAVGAVEARGAGGAGGVGGAGGAGAVGGAGGAEVVGGAVGAGVAGGAEVAGDAGGAPVAGGRVTERGVRMARLGLHPRLARALLDGAPLVGARRAAELVALLGEEPPREYGDDVAVAWRAARRGGDAYGARWRREAGRLERQLAGVSGGAGAAAGGAGGAGHAGARGGVRSSGAGFGGGLSDDMAAGVVVALAFPERVARARGGGSFLMVAGTGAEVGRESGLRSAGWLAVAVADRPAHSASARVRLAAVCDEDTARLAAGHLLVAGDEVRWQDGDVVARSVERLGAVDLAVRPLGDAAPGLVREALLEGLRREGLGLLRWSPDAVRLRERLAFLHRVVGAPWPDVSDGALVERAGEWLEPELSAARRRAGLARIDAGESLRRLLPWASGDAARLDELAPERIEVPSGSRIRVEYGGEQPVLAVKLQEMFGLARTPRVAGVPVLVHLLSPAGRPAAVTADLESFWRDGYRAVRAELRGRYPKHPWPEDPAAAPATRRTNPRR